MTTTLESFRVDATGGALGGFVTGFDARRVEPSDVLRLKRALAEHRILIFRDQRLTDDEFVAFGTLFGPLFVPPPEIPVLGSNVGGSAVVTIDNVSEGLLGASELYPHTDHIWTPYPSSASLLYALEIPSSGGDTTWFDLIGAYDALDEATKREIAALTVVTFNPFLHGDSYTGELARSLQPESARFAHPLVRTHVETGRKTLYFSPFNDVEFVGLSEREGDDLRLRLRAHVTQARFGYEHRWTVGDLVFWDNTATLHARSAFDPCERRVMRRVSLGGGRPF